ncbi:MAG: hypothetical protein WDO19_06815 [Bacteroidota bacterium]
MADNLKDILSNLSPDIDQETLMLYLQNKLPEEKRHEVEKTLMDNEFADDAMEGLQQFNDKKQIDLLVEQLNTDLRHKLEKKKQRREKIAHKRAALALYICPYYFNADHYRLYNCAENAVASLIAFNIDEQQ